MLDACGASSDDDDGFPPPPLPGADYNQGKGSIYMVMEFCDHDLTGLTDAGQKFTVPQIKCYMKQLLEGLAYCHGQKVLHRDIKGSNLLISNDGQLKLADFGLARAYDSEKQHPYTNRVITLWYRPPELLLGATMYGPAIDMWSAGCIFAELLLRKPILPGKNEFEQIDLIFKLLGTPDEKEWPKCKELQYYDLILSQTPRKYHNRFDEKFAGLDEQAKDLLRKLLMVDPDKRINAEQALDHDYFWNDPVPAHPSELPKYPPSHEFTAKKRRQAQQPNGSSQAQASQQQAPPASTHPPGAQPHQGGLPLPVSSGQPPPGYGGPLQHHPPMHYQPQQQQGYPMWSEHQAPGGPYRHPPPSGVGGPPAGYPPHKRHRPEPGPGGGGGGFFDGGGGHHGSGHRPHPSGNAHTNNPYYRAPQASQQYGSGGYPRPR